MDAIPRPAHLAHLPENPDRPLKNNEIRSMLRGFRCLRYREGNMTGRDTIAIVIAEEV